MVYRYSRTHYLENKGEKYKGQAGKYILGKRSNGSNVYFSERELLFHSLIIGRTGTGKSTFLRSILKNIGSLENTNIIMIDFHGSLANQICSDLSNKEIVYFGTDMESQIGVGINILSGARNNPVSLYLLSKILSKEESFSSGTWGPRLQTIFTAILRKAVELNENLTLGDFLNIINNREKMKEIINKSDEHSKNAIKNLIIKWDRWSEYISSSINKLLPLVSDCEISSLIGRREDTVDIHRLLREGNSLIIIDTSKTRHSQQQSSIIAGAILNRIWTDVISRGTVKKTVIIIDEAQNLNSSLVNEILSEGRKFNLFLFLSSQFFLQYDEEIQESILSNCGNFYIFNVSKKDADRISSLVGNIRLRDSILKSILEGGMHNITYVGTRAENGLRVDSFKSILLEDDYKIPDFKGSIRKYGRKIENETNLYGNKEDHKHQSLEILIESYLKSKGYRVFKETDIGGLKPDLFFFKNGVPVFVEVENSDIKHKSRIVEKAINYSASYMIFLCGENESTSLRDFFLNKEKIIHYLDELKMEGRNTFFNPLKISIIEERKNTFYISTESGLRRWSPEFLFNSSFRMKENEDPHLLEIMEKSKTHFIKNYNNINNSDEKKTVLDFFI
ncbi:ATP-binding protein [Caldiplasma sukawensis]